MKIIIAGGVTPFIEDEVSLTIDRLELKLKECGHKVESVKIPFSLDHSKIIPQLLALRLYHLEDECDRLICINMPACLIGHTEKYLWLCGGDTRWPWQTDPEALKNDEIKAIREYTARACERALSEAKKICARPETDTDWDAIIHDLTAEGAAK